MKRTVKTSRAAGYIEKMFRTINADSFGGVIEEPIITIQTTPGAYGHVSVAKIWNRGGEERHELNIAADWLDRPIEQTVATLIHEMVHLLNLQNGVQDCSRGGSYHNKRFKEEAEKHMIQIDKSEKYGWTITSPTDELLEYILKQGWEEFEMSRGCHLGIGGSGGGKISGGSGGVQGGAIKPKGSNSRKYVCPGCGAIVRTTRDLEIICKPCMLEFVLQ